LESLLGWVPGLAAHQEMEVLEVRETVDEESKNDLPDEAIGSGQKDFRVAKCLCCVDQGGQYPGWRIVCAHAG
jgi:hypothetical protein